MSALSERDLASLCREQGLRLTGPRQIILQVLSKLTDHPDVEELHRRITAIDPSISLATVYRTVNLLRERGILERHVFADGRSRYETTGTEHHDHLIDIETGDVIEFTSPEIEQLQEEIARRHGFRIVSHRLEIYVERLKPKRSPRTK